ncbi:MAG: flagellar filament capping protein FliD [Lachnospiraceae bacterium]|nr:flagellar filament capping protein FliD [Lachnospiraceae bacterium]
MSDRIRMSGMISGMDTDSIVQQLVQAKSTKVDKMKGTLQKTEWKQDIWKELNTKMYSFYSKTLDNMRNEGSFNKMKASIVDSSIASVSASSSAVIGTQTLAVKQLAKSGYITGGKIASSDASSGDTTLYKLGALTSEDEVTVKIKSSADGDYEEITLNQGMTLTQVASAFAEKGINASYDATNQRFFLSSKESGADADFDITADSDEGLAVLANLGLSASGATDDEENEIAGAWNNIDGQDAIIYLNGAEFESSTNTFSINGLSITAQSVSEKDTNGDYITTNVSTSSDVDAIYDMIKDFFSEYNELIKEMDEKYNAESSSSYDVLTDDEKSAMSEDEIEKWNEKIKSGLLRRDESLNKNIRMFKDAMSSMFEVGDSSYSLSSFGIGTLSYFLAGDNEKGVYHIDGDEDDTNTSGNEDKLKTMIATDPETVTSFFTQLSNNLYKQITEATKHSEYRSVYSMYDDKTLQEEYDNLESDIADEEESLADFEDSYYDKFAAMETALAKLQEKQNAISSLLGS